jgi:hypothetical protein
MIRIKTNREIHALICWRYSIEGKQVALYDYEFTVERAS